MKALNTNLNHKIKTKVVSGQQHVEYHYFVPKNIEKTLVLVHGISRNAYEVINEFSELAETHGYLLIAPIFKKEFSNDYQRLGRQGKGPRSDYQLMSIVKDCQSAFKTNDKRFDLFGFSAGAQFAHRFAFAHPNLINKVALVAAGWYTLPTIKYQYPIGTRINKQFSDIVFEPKRFLRTQFKVYIGSKDNERNSSLNRNKKIDSSQGENRIVRAKTWVESMQKKMMENNINNTVHLEVLINVNHAFSDCVKNAQLVSKVMGWLKEGKTNV